ncbi:MAG TPA: sigma 54-interacting transcriptional regulator [Candidatus Binataceae bacterium]|nr:sigma 54-interacting transcriptional regulator [Candidatus Binataceae bacterium]
MSSVTQLKPSAVSAVHRNNLSYYHLLWDHELAELGPIMDALASHRREILEHWYQLYLLHFGDERSLAQSEFFDLCGLDLDATTETLRAGTFEQFVIRMRRIGVALAERRVPFAEVVASMHLFEESAIANFPPGTDPLMHRVFDKVSHCRIIALSEAYFRDQAALAAARIHSLEKEAGLLGEEVRTSFHGLVGATPVMRRLYARIEAAAGVRGTVLIVGESGAGKELVARAVHECSRTPAAPFVALNCSAIPRELIESELFGYKRGAFSGATIDYQGLFRAAEGGTLFLDEITEMSAATQSKLLRALQERTVRPVGSTREVPFDVRVIASSNRDPQAAVRQGVLREDLYYRLQVNLIEVPPLRERLADVPLLADHFIALFNRRMMRTASVTGVEPQALDAMERYDWPGNVRELSNAIESAFTFGPADTIRLADLPPAIAATAGVEPPPLAVAPAGSATLSFADTERDLIRRALVSTGGNKLRAAKLLGISRKRLYARVRRYRLD